MDTASSSSRQRVTCIQCWELSNISCKFACSLEVQILICVLRPAIGKAALWLISASHVRQWLSPAFCGRVVDFVLAVVPDANLANLRNTIDTMDRASQEIFGARKAEFEEHTSRDRSNIMDILRECCVVLNAHGTHRSHSPRKQPVGRGLSTQRPGAARTDKVMLFVPIVFCATLMNSAQHDTAGRSRHNLRLTRQNSAYTGNSFGSARQAQRGVGGGAHLFWRAHLL